MNPVYYRLSIHGLPLELEEEASEICFRYGSGGVSEALDFEQADLKYLPQIKPKVDTKLDAFFENAPDPACLSELSALSPKIALSVFDEKNKDWLEEWKKGFEPFALVEKIWVVPSWFEAPKEATTALFIDPGMAFGTGTHETTQLAARLVWDFFASQKSTSTTVLDVGTGTGILALLAESLGAKQVQALEIDPIARAVARENLAINKSAVVVLPEHQIEDEDATYDLVIANIIDGVLLELKGSLLNCTGKGRDLILSGILSGRIDEFVPQFLEGTDLQVVQRLSMGEWEALWLKRK